MAVMHRAVSRIGSATSDDADIDSPIGITCSTGMTHGVTSHRCESSVNYNVEHSTLSPKPGSPPDVCRPMESDDDYARDVGGDSHV